MYIPLKDTLRVQVRCREEPANALTFPVSGSNFSLRLEHLLAKPTGSTTHAKRPKEAFLFCF